MRRAARKKCASAWSSPVYATNFRRAFPDGADDDGWAAALPLVELVAAAPEPMKVETAKAMLGITGDARVF